MRKLRLGIALFSAIAFASPDAPASFDDAQAFLKTYCESCHSGKSPTAGFNLAQVSGTASLKDQANRWSRIVIRVRNAEMPPVGLPAPTLDQRESFVKWVDQALHAEACAAGPVPGPNPIRRLNRDQYTATVRELLDIHLDVGHDLPADGGGGEGFDNAAEVLFLSPILAEKYLEAAKTAIDFAIRDSRGRARLGLVKPGPGATPAQAAQKLLSDFLPRAFRRAVTESELAPFLALFREAQKQRQSYDGSVAYMLRGVLMSSKFLFRVEPPNPDPAPRPLDDYALASRLSYFLWNNMPDEMMLDLASLGKLHDPDVLKEEIGRTLRSGKSMGFVESFVTQWLGTRALGREHVPDIRLFPKYGNDAELQADVRLQPIVFFQTILASNGSLLDLLDSNWTIVTRTLARFYMPGLKLRAQNDAQPHRQELPADSHRGGVLAMPAVLAVSSYPYRTSPVLRGKWVLEAILGTPPPAPPPNVPPIEATASAQPKTMRERLAQHRENPVCASCHSRIDPIGFALENFDAIGQWRTEDAGQPIDAHGELPDGTKFEGPEQLKAVLLQKKDVFLRNLTSRMLGYALGRGLTRQDSCAVDSIMEQVMASGYKSQTLIEAIVMSQPFRYQAGQARPQ